MYLLSTVFKKTKTKKKRPGMVLFGIIIQKKLLSIRRNFRKHDEQLKLLFNESIDDVHM